MGNGEYREGQYWNPRYMIREIERMVDNLRMGLEEMAMPVFHMGPSRVPATDIKDEGDKYVLEAELPGLEKENVTVEVGEDSLFIRAQKTESVEEEKKNYVRKERGQINFYRCITLPRDVDAAGIEASLSNGVLKVIMPKTPQPVEVRRKVEIK